LIRDTERRSAVLAAIGLLLLPACGPGRAPGPAANVLLVTLDTTRADFFGTYGFPGRGTPALDALAREGALFETAISTASVTPVAHASILTGLEPQHHGLRVFSAESGFRLPAGVPTLATILRARGFRTGAVHSSFAVSGYFGLDQGISWLESFEAGFQKEEEGKHRWDVARYQRRSDDATALALDFLKETGEPFFLWVHYWDPHDAELLPPAPYLAGVPEDTSRRNRELYAAEVRYLDAQLGRLLAALRERGAYDRTLVAVTSDHGEGLGDHDWTVHRLLYQEQIRVPLILRIPGEAPAGPRRELARVTDIVPTLLDHLGLDPTAELDGASLKGILRGSAETPRLAYADQINGYDLNSNVGSRRPLDDFLYCVMDSRWKLVYRPEFPERSELFDLSRDPGEGINLYESEERERRRLEGELARRNPWVTLPFAAGGVSAAERALAQEALESLGYTGGGTGGAPQWIWSCPAHPDLAAGAGGSCPRCSEPLLLRAGP
jgi:arylsulfatase A-like enzyme